MEEEIVHLLRDLNRDFYDTFAGAFDRSRAPTEPGVERILEQVQSGEHFLDLGCGQGRVALLLPEETSYVGVDFSAEMVALARRKSRAAGIPARFVVADLLEEPWLPEVGEDFDWILLRAVLHHVPGFAWRAAVVRRAAERLASGGHLVVANWQFLELPSLRRRLLPWDTVGLHREQVEEGDYLLDWKREGYGLRYVHLVDEEETQRLAEAAELQVELLYRADGRNNRLTLYAVLSRESD
ncbi:MAG: class I SAM-dependent methyltransferase [Anaerolineales bacterium]